MAINNIVSNIALSNGLQLSNGALDTKLVSGGGLSAASSGLIVSQDFLCVLNSFHITSAEFKDLVGNPIRVLGVPGAGNIINVNRMELKCVYGGVQYSNGGDVGLQYGPGPYDANKVICAFGAGFINGINSSRIIGLSANPYSVATPENQPIYFIAKATNFTTGNSDFYLNIWYKIYALS